MVGDAAGTGYAIAATRTPVYIYCKCATNETLRTLGARSLGQRLKSGAAQAQVAGAQGVHPHLALLQRQVLLQQVCACSRNLPCKHLFTHYNCMHELG